MKIYILTDFEGVGGVLNRSQVMAGSAAYEKAREWLTMDVNAAVDGAIDGGATEVVVLDAHGANSAVNFIYDKLHGAARYIQGAPWTEYPQGLDDSFDAMLQVGVHAMAGTQGAILEHTMSSLSWVEMTINGKPMGEIGLTTAIAGECGVPLVMVSGDDKACREAQTVSPHVECAIVKEGITRHCAKLLPQSEVHRLIHEKACLGVAKAKRLEPFVIDGPVEIQIEYFRNETVDDLKEREGVKKIGPRRVAYTGDTVREAVWHVWGA